MKSETPNARLKRMLKITNMYGFRYDGADVHSGVLDVHLVNDKRKLRLDIHGNAGNNITFWLWGCVPLGITEKVKSATELRKMLRVFTAVQCRVKDCQGLAPIDGEVLCNSHLKQWKKNRDLPGIVMVCRRCRTPVYGGWIECESCRVITCQELRAQGRLLTREQIEKAAQEAVAEIKTGEKP